ncbi:ATP-grasp domain-containing protein [Elizabethkingia meningoseptica]|uniref:ATP-grasp domain-containing protein n=1 Tax=Elizabethkingia meningoseptica TaxID=238 RepID=UPI0023B10A13|nr:ATP-grasp domain-containing protein [Elizabethkingia meningoseptica]MDE5491020.1 ATP-grasp domain-containing protein [Elizabethkingia meningoseptica]
MYVLIQSNIHKDPDFDRIYPILEDLGIQYEKINLDSSIKSLKVSQNRNDIFVYGSVKLAMLAAKNLHWKFGSFYGGNHRHEVNSIYYKENLLNYHAKIYKLQDHQPWNEDEQKFIKPYQFAKLFTGNVFTKTKWEDFVKNTLENPPTSYINADSLVQSSVPRDIIKEARLWIIGGKIVDAIYYKILKDIPFEEKVSQDGIDFAEKMISLFNVADAFVMDICETDIGWKIVEVNCINSSGFFPNTNIKKIFSALNKYFTEE